MTGPGWLHGVGMFVLGGICLVAVGAAFTMRVNRPLPIAAHALPVATAGTFATARSTTSVNAVTAALQGLSANLRSALDALTSHRSSAPLLDAAWHVAQVIDYNAPAARIRTLRDSVTKARTALQNGNHAMAIALVRDALETTAGATPLVVFPAISPRNPRQAIMLDATGNRIGTLIGYGDQQVIIETPSLRDILGFVTLTHGSRRTLPVDRVLFGEPSRSGDTFAVSVP